jgi:hypothetical protein
VESSAPPAPEPVTQPNFHPYPEMLFCAQNSYISLCHEHVTQDEIDDLYSQYIQPLDLSQKLAKDNYLVRMHKFRRYNGIPENGDYMVLSKDGIHVDAMRVQDGRVQFIPSDRKTPDLVRNENDEAVRRILDSYYIASKLYHAPRQTNPKKRKWQRMQSAKTKVPGA